MNCGDLSTIRKESENVGHAARSPQDFTRHFPVKLHKES